MARRITDPTSLAKGLVWVLLHYDDGSEFCFQTTTNPAILAQHGIVLEEGKLVRLDKTYLEQGQMVYRQFDYVGVRISLWDAEHYTDRTSAILRLFV